MGNPQSKNSPEHFETPSPRGPSQQTLASFTEPAEVVGIAQVSTHAFTQRGPLPHFTDFTNMSRPCPLTHHEQIRHGAVNLHMGMSPNVPDWGQCFNWQDHASSLAATSRKYLCKLSVWSTVVRRWV